MSLIQAMADIGTVAAEVPGIERAYSTAPPSNVQYPSVIVLPLSGTMAAGNDWMWTHQLRVWLLVGSEQHDQITALSRAAQLTTVLMEYVDYAHMTNHRAFEPYDRVAALSYRLDRMYELAGAMHYGAEILVEVKEHVSDGAI